MTRFFALVAVAALAAGLAPAGAFAASRDQIRIVGSSTVFPFSAAVAEEFGRMTRFFALVAVAALAAGLAPAGAFAASRDQTARPRCFPSRPPWPRNSGA